MAIRRTVAVAFAVALLTSTAGCGFILGNEALTFSAEKATVGQQALDQTGYEEQNVETQVVTRNFTVAGQTRSVEVTNWLSRYERSVDLGPLGSQRAAAFVALSSPEVSVAGKTFNPLADMSSADLLAQFETEYDGMTVGQQVSSTNVTALGKSTRVDKFEGTATLDGQEVDVYIQVTKVKHDGDFVVALGVYPQRLDGEGEKVRALMKGLEH